MGVVVDLGAGAVTRAAGGILLGFGVPSAGLVGSGAIAIGGSVAGLGPAAIGIFGSSLCDPPPPPPSSCEE